MMNYLFRSTSQTSHSQSRTWVSELPTIPKERPVERSGSLRGRPPMSLWRKSRGKEEEPDMLLKKGGKHRAKNIEGPAVRGRVLGRRSPVTVRGSSSIGKSPMQKKSSMKEGQPGIPFEKAGKPWVKGKPAVKQRRVLTRRLPRRVSRSLSRRSSMKGKSPAKEESGQRKPHSRSISLMRKGPALKQCGVLPRRSPSGSLSRRSPSRSLSSMKGNGRAVKQCKVLTRKSPRKASRSRRSMKGKSPGKEKSEGRQGMALRGRRCKVLSPKPLSRRSSMKGESPAKEDSGQRKPWLRSISLMTKRSAVKQCRDKPKKSPVRGKLQRRGINKRLRSRSKTPQRTKKSRSRGRSKKPQRTETNKRSRSRRSRSRSKTPQRTGKNKRSKSRSKKTQRTGHYNKLRSRSKNPGNQQHSDMQLGTPNESVRSIPPSENSNESRESLNTLDNQFDSRRTPFSMNPFCQSIFGSISSRIKDLIGSRDERTQFEVKESSRTEDLGNGVSSVEEVDISMASKHGTAQSEYLVERKMVLKYNKVTMRPGTTSNYGTTSNDEQYYTVQDVLTKWYNDNIDHPYPTITQMRSLANECGITEKEVSMWLRDKRRIDYLPGVQKMSKAKNNDDNSESLE